jgi:hypothetical protein
MATATVTPDQDAVIAEVFIAAPPTRVFEAISDPSQVSKWWGQQGLYRVTEQKSDMRPGGKWISNGVGADGAAFSVEGEYLEVDPPRGYAEVHNLHPSGPKKAGTGTKLVIRHTGFAGGPPNGAASHGEGWNRVMGWLRQYVEEGKGIDGR